MKIGISKLKIDIKNIESDINFKTTQLHKNRAILRQQLKSTKVIFGVLISSFTLGFLITPSKNKFINSTKDTDIITNKDQESTSRKNINKLDIMAIVTSLASYLRLLK